MADDEGYREADESRGLDLQRISDFLNRRWRVMAIAMGCALVPALAIPFLLPAEYRGIATIRFERPAAVLMFGADFMPQAGSPPPRLSSPLSQMMALAQSGTVLGRVIDASPDLGIEVEPTDLWERLRLAQRLNDIANWGLTPADVSEAQDREAKIGGLRAALELGDVGRSGSILGISVAHPDAAAAAALANAVAESLTGYLLEERNAASRTAIAWLRQKSTELRDGIQRREQVALRLASEADLPSSAFGNLEGDVRQDLTEAMEATRINLLTVEQQLSILAPRVSAWVGQSADVETVITRIGNLRAQYLSAREDLERLRSRLTDSSPAVLRMVSHVEKLQQELRSAGISKDGTAGGHLNAYRGLVLERETLNARQNVLEESLQALVAEPENDAQSSALTEYQRALRELLIDRNLLEVVLVRLNETSLSAGTEHGSATILDYAVPPALPQSPNRPRAIGIGLTLAVLFGLGMGVLLELIDVSVYDASEAARELGAPYLGSIPIVSGAISPEQQALRQDVSAAGESFRNLRTAIQFQTGSRELRSLLITSAASGEGKTMLAVNLATTFSSGQRRVVLLDADLRRPRVDSATGVPREPGLVEVLRSKHPLSEVIQTPAVFNFAAGETPRHPPELLNSDAFGRVLTDLVQQFDLVVIDAPVLLAVSDAQLLSSRVDGTLVVHSPGAADRRALQRMRVNLERARAHVLGLVYNKVQPPDLDPYEEYLAQPAPSKAPESGSGA